jgi:endonuclease YncB( thermonuclease family)
MASGANRSGARRYRTGRSQSGLLVALVFLVGLIGFYAYRSSTSKPPPSPLIGRARVLDGDSIEISGARIRLQGIDAPESDQTCADARGQTWPCGKAAAQELRRHIGARELRCEPRGLDRYHRILAICFVPDGSDVNAWMVRQGWALAYGDGSNYRSAQHEAEAAKRGIWVGAFVSPGEWRRRHPQSRNDVPGAGALRANPYEARWPPG